MSGTSLDGVDAALIRTDGDAAVDHGPSRTEPYPDVLRSALRSVLGGVGPVAEVERAVTLFHADVARRLLDQGGIAVTDVDVVGFHGHTILHRPDQHRTWQIGDGALLARTLGIPVVNDFRSADVAAGGEGAPLVPAYHRALAGALDRPVAILNLGGVGNVTWIGGRDAEEQILAFDTGPGNALIDDWMLRRTGRPFDRDGALALDGRIDAGAVATFLDHPYFARRPPKSLDRDDFAALAARLTDGMAPADGAATLTAITVAAVRAAARHLPAPPTRWLVCGGGRQNGAIMQGLAAALMAPVEPVDMLAWNGDALEAEAFAYLAVRSLRGMALTWPGTTGVARPLAGGRLHRPA